jgi:hypothetical protein
VLAVAVVMFVATAALVVPGLSSRASAGIPTPAIPASGQLFDREAAVIYADRYTCNGESKGACANTAYRFDVRHNNDCTDFISQSLAAAGLPQSSILHGVDGFEWYYSNSWTGARTHSASWTVVGEFAHYMTAVAHYATITPITDLTAATTGAQKGDVYLYDWTGDGIYDHAALAVGIGTAQGTPLPGAPATGDLIDQHTHDLLRAPWNWEYLNPRSSHYAQRDRIKVSLLHFDF